MFTVGESVALLYDGKFCRAVEGKITYVSPQEKTIQIIFTPYANEEAGNVIMFARINRKKSCASGYLKDRGELGIMKGLGAKGDYYRVYKKDFVISEGYKVKVYV